MVRPKTLLSQPPILLTGSCYQNCALASVCGKSFKAFCLSVTHNIRLTLELDMATALAINMETEPLVPTRKDSFEAETKLFKDHAHSDNEAQVYDVRRQVIARSLVPCIVEGLKSEVKESPPLLLWDDRGLSLFDAILDSPQYYPARREWALLRKTIQDIARNIPNRSRVVELGAGFVLNVHPDSQYTDKASKGT